MILGFRETPCLKGIRQRRDGGQPTTLFWPIHQWVSVCTLRITIYPYRCTPNTPYKHIQYTHTKGERERRGREGRNEGKGECAKRQTWETTEHRVRNLSPNKKCSLKLSFWILYFQCRIPTQAWWFTSFIPAFKNKRRGSLWIYELESSLVFRDFQASQG